MLTGKWTPCSGWTPLIAAIAILMIARPSAAQPVTTVLTHGYSLDASKGPWVEAMGDAIIARGGGAGAVCRYQQDSGAWRLLSGPLSEPDHVVLIHRWLNDFDKSGPDVGFVEGAADALYAALRDPIFEDAIGDPLPAIDLITDRNLHFLGHSRGACVNSECVERFAVAGIIIDHVTTMDPHPVNGTLDAPFDFDWGDPTPVRWDNVTFWDNYWRADGGGIPNGFDFDGIPLPNTFDNELDEGALNCCAYSFAHSDTHLWLHGTIDLAPNPCDGDQCINAEMRNTWWPEGYTERGYYYSRIGGGAAFRPAIPPGAPAGFVATLYGGSFDDAGHAGWLYHGGSVGGQIVNESGATFLKLGAGVGLTSTHNRFFLEANAGAIVLDYLIQTSGAGDTLDITLTARDGTVYAIGLIALAGPPTGWVTDVSVAIPPTVDRSRTYTMTLAVTGKGPVSAVVGVDNIRIEAGAAVIGDLDGDGDVDAADLAILLGGWGVCPVPPADCPGDLDGNGVVDAADLAVLLGHWTGG